MRLLIPVILGLASLLMGPASQAAPIPTRPVYTNNARFRIPFRFDAAEIQRLNAREIRLYLSTDDGINWHSAQSVSPRAGRFDFEAPQDGAYWFAVRTVDHAGQMHPPGPILEPGLKVVVDTDPPSFRISVTQLQPGKVHLAWTSSDLRLDPTTLRLEYIQTGASQWQPVRVTPGADGRTTWSVPNGGVVAVRGSISDLAGNVTRAQNQAKIAPANAAVPRPAVPDFRQPIAESLPNSELSLAEEFSIGPSSADVPQTIANSSPARGGAASALRNLPADKFQPVGVPNPPGRLISDNADARPEITKERYPRVEEEVAAPVEPAPAGRPDRIVNSRKFLIEYRLEDVGPSGVSRVELFITQNHGAKWWKYGDDPDRQSPFQIEVPGDGAYGFALRVQSGTGLVDEPPRPGENPAIVIAVDQTPPFVRLMPLEQGSGSSQNQIGIRWQVTDDHPAAQPIALDYSISPDGPWHPICEWQPDTSSYQWTVGPGVPSRVYVRLTARDAAGNVTHALTSQPLVVDLARPSARIVDIEASGTIPPQR